MRSLTWRRPPRTDLVANLLFYLPFGALRDVARCRRRWRPAAPRPVHARRAAPLLSMLIECAQSTTVSRDPSITDVMLNALSAGIAALLALGARGLGLAARRCRSCARTAPDVVAVLVDRALDRLARRAVHADDALRLRTSRTRVRALDWHWSSGAFAGFFAGYVLLGAVLRQPAAADRASGGCSSRSRRCSLVARIVFREQRLEINECVAFVLALPIIWRMTSRHRSSAAYRARRCCGPRRRSSSSALAPFDFSARLPDFEWLTLPPLTSRLNSGEPGLLDVAFFYIGAVWLLREARVPLGASSLAMLTTALLIEVAQAWEPNRSGAARGAAGGAARRARSSGLRDRLEPQRAPGCAFGLTGCGCAPACSPRAPAIAGYV